MYEHSFLKPSVTQKPIMMATKHKGLHARSMETIVFHYNLRITLSPKDFYRLQFSNSSMDY